MSRTPIRKRSASVKAAADRAEKRAKGEPIETPKVAIDPVIEKAEPTKEIIPTIYRVPSTGAGRPTVYTPELCQIAAQGALDGWTDEEIAETLGVDVRTLYRWRAKYPEFRQSLAWGKENCDERVERKLYERAVGYTYDAVKIMMNEGQPVIVAYKEHAAPDVGAAKMWLTNRKRKDWAERSQVEHGGPGDFDNMSPDELDQFIASETEALRAPEKSVKPASKTKH